MNPIKVMIVDDHAVLRSGLRMLLDAQPDMRVVGEAGNANEAVERLPACKPDVVTLDLTMPGSTGLGALRRIRESAPNVRVLILTMHDDSTLVRSAMAMGASGYLLKSVADTELVSAVRAVAAGELFTSADGSPQAAPPSERSRRGRDPRSPVERLSERERIVLGSIAHGFTNQQVADKLGLSVKTVESYRARLMKKLRLTSRADLVRLAIEMGVLSEGARGMSDGGAIRV